MNSKPNQPPTPGQPGASKMTEPPRARPEQHQTSSGRATEKAKTGEPLRAERPGERSPKQENL